MTTEAPVQESQDFSLVLGGPLYQLLRRLGLIRPPLQRVGPRMIVITAVAWLPLAVLTLVDGTFFGGVKVPFVRDVEVQARLLASLPLLIAAEVVINSRITGIIQQFLERGIVTPTTRPRYQAILDSAVRARNSIPIEVGMALLVFVLGNFLWQHAVSVHQNAWYATASGDEFVYTLAGRWYAFVSVPIVQFILLRWYFRLAIWCWILWQLSRLDLSLIPTHPDRSCGLGFLGGVVFAMAPFLMAHTCFLAGYLANQILYNGQKLPDHKLDIGAVILLLLLVTLGPISVFAPRLSRARLMGLRHYGRLASDYVLAFDRRWISERPLGEDSLLGSADIQSLADLANSFQVIQGIRLVPFGRETLVPLVAIIAIPLLPLGLTMFSLTELVHRLIGLLL